MSVERGPEMMRITERILPLHEYGIIAAAQQETRLICRRCGGMVLMSWPSMEARGIDQLIRAIREHEKAVHP